MNAMWSIHRDWDRGSGAKPWFRKALGQYSRIWGLPQDWLNRNVVYHFRNSYWWENTAFEIVFIELYFLLLSLFSVEQIVVCAFRMLDCLVHLMVQSCCKPSSCEYTACIIMLKSFFKKLYNGYGRLKISLLYRCMRYCSCEF